MAASRVVESLTGSAHGLPTIIGSPIHPQQTQQRKEDDNISDGQSAPHMTYEQQLQQTGHQHSDASSSYTYSLDDESMMSNPNGHPRSPRIRKSLSATENESNLLGEMLGSGSGNSFEAKHLNMNTVADPEQDRPPTPSSIAGQEFINSFSGEERSTSPSSSPIARLRKQGAAGRSVTNSPQSRNCGSSHRHETHSATGSAQSASQMAGSKASSGGFSSVGDDRRNGAGGGLSDQDLSTVDQELSTLVGQFHVPSASASISLTDTKEETAVREAKKRNATKETRVTNNRNNESNSIGGDGKDNEVSTHQLSRAALSQQMSPRSSNIEPPGATALRTNDDDLRAEPRKAKPESGDEDDIFSGISDNTSSVIGDGIFSTGRSASVNSSVRGGGRSSATKKEAVPPPISSGILDANTPPAATDVQTASPRSMRSFSESQQQHPMQQHQNGHPHRNRKLDASGRQFPPPAEDEVLVNEQQLLSQPQNQIKGRASGTPTRNAVTNGINNSSTGGVGPGTVVHGKAMSAVHSDITTSSINNGDTVHRLGSERPGTKMNHNGMNLAANHTRRSNRIKPAVIKEEETSEGTSGRDDIDDVFAPSSSTSSSDDLLHMDVRKKAAMSNLSKKLSETTEGTMSDQLPSDLTDTVHTDGSATDGEYTADNSAFNLDDFVKIGSSIMETLAVGLCAVPGKSVCPSLRRKRTHKLFTSPGFA